MYPYYLKVVEHSCEKKITKLVDLKIMVYFSQNLSQIPLWTFSFILAINLKIKHVQGHVITLLEVFKWTEKMEHFFLFKIKIIPHMTYMFMKQYPPYLDFNIVSQYRELERKSSIFKMSVILIFVATLFCQNYLWNMINIFKKSTWKHPIFIHNDYKGSHSFNTNNSRH